MRRDFLCQVVEPSGPYSDSYRFVVCPELREELVSSLTRIADSLPLGTRVWVTIETGRPDSER